MNIIVGMFAVLALLTSVAQAKFGLVVKPTSVIDFGKTLNPDAAPYLFASKISLEVTNKAAGAVPQWYLSLAANGNFISASRPSLSMPLSRLAWRRTGTSTYLTMTTVPALVISGTSTGTFTYAIDFQLSPAWTDPAVNDYRADLVVLLTDTP